MSDFAIEKNKVPFFCISAYEGNFELLDYTENFKVYVKVGAELDFIPESSEVVPNYGFNIYAYLLFIVTHYEDLPDKVLFTKNNIFPRHLSREKFEFLLQSSATDFYDSNTIKHHHPFSYCDIDGKFYEYNNDWYVRRSKMKYFGSSLEFQRHFFGTEITPIYLNFVPGCNILVEKQQILNRPIEFYKRLIDVLVHKENAEESYFVERYFKYIFDLDVKISDSYMSEFLVVSEAQYRCGLLRAFYRRCCEVFLKAFIR